MKQLLPVFAALLLSSCAVKVIPLKGNYPKPPISFVTQSKPDAVWANIIEFMSTNGINVKLLEKASGLIITEDYKFNKMVTYENKKTGQVNNALAYLVSNYKVQSQVSIKPDFVYANWNVRMKETPEGTLVNINLTNIRSVKVSYYKSMALAAESDFDIRSTGVFEKMIFEFVK